MLTQVTSVLHHNGPGPADTVVFVHPDFPERDTQVILEPDVYDDMGQPERITVTVQPGDVVNDGPGLG